MKEFVRRTEESDQLRDVVLYLAVALRKE